MKGKNYEDSKIYALYSYFKYYLPDILYTVMWCFLSIIIWVGLADWMYDFKLMDYESCLWNAAIIGVLIVILVVKHKEKEDKENLHKFLNELDENIEKINKNETIITPEMEDMIKRPAYKYFIR